MPINYNPHGEYEIDTSLLSSQILIIRAKGSWNTQTAQECVDKVLHYADVLKPHPWAFVEDIREWDLCTPEVMEVFTLAIKVMLKKNFRVRAVLPRINLHKDVIKLTMEKKQPVATEFFIQPEEAIVWCRSQLGNIIES
ncbi:hypothetical protein L4C34_14650 [Vibrio profundum]|uniref:hypothetical protein n=1 Tax=Vibrio profundum TaxID=2910247 RepID=UPI003D10CA21